MSAGVAVLSLAAAFGGIGSASASSSAHHTRAHAAAGAPIKIASLASISGAASFAGWQLGAKAYFDAVNRAGGINGHKVQFQIFDDAGSPTQDTQIASKEVNAGVVGFAGSISLGDCAVNGPYYDKVGVVSVDVGSDPTCFDNPNIAPVNSGPLTDPELQMLYAAEVLHDTRICALTLAIPGESAQAAGAVAGFEKLSGKKIDLWVKDYPVNANPAPAVLEFKNAKCQAVSLSVQDTQGVPILKDAEADGIHNITWISGLGLYEASFAKAVGSAGNGMYLGLEFAPFNIPQSAQMLSAFKADGLPLSQPEESSYTAAWVFGHVLSTISGPITRASVLHAFRTIKPFTVPTLGTPFSFGTAKAHHPNEAAFFTKIVNGQFQNVKKAESWYILPGYKAPTS